MIDETFDYVAYLSLKKAIDDRSLNPEVWQEMIKWINNNQNKKQIKILEIGAGIGTMIERVLESIFPENCSYFAVEPEPGFQDAARQRLQDWASSNNISFSISGNNSWLLKKGEHQVLINWICSDAEQIISSFDDNHFDLLIAHAVVDILPVPVLMPALLDKLDEKGAFYFSLNYSGITQFLPEHECDKNLMKLYNQDMDKRFTEQGWQASVTGQILRPWLQDAGYKVLAEGESNWQLGAGEKHFITYILDTIKKALSQESGLPFWDEDRRRLLEEDLLRLDISNTDIFGLKK